jgi:(R,R)-butanediol dehydrogenase/meso-butanediol dehydrogenase/diacetyl reductase
LKAILLKGPGEVIIEEVPVPEISDDEVLVEVKYCGICGSDIHSIKNCVLVGEGTYLGHEFSGVVAKLGKNVEGWKIGDRVVTNPSYECGECYACRHGITGQCVHGWEHEIGNSPGKDYAGGFAQFVRVPIPHRRLHRLPDEVSFEQGALSEPLACALHAVKSSDFGIGDQVMILGAGPIGLGVIAFLRLAGAGLIIATEINQKRTEVAKKFGADYVFNPQTPALKEEILRLTDGKGIDVIFDCSGVAQAFQSATNFLRRGGQIMLQGIIEEDVKITPMDWSINEWHLQGVMNYGPDDFAMAINFMKNGALPVEEMITSKIKLSNIIKDGFDALGKPKHNEVKILVEPDV